MSARAQKAETAVSPSSGLPFGFGIELDPGSREIRRGVWFGGQPARIVKLSTAGAAALEALRAGVIGTRLEALVARRLTDAGLAHPVPASLVGPPDVTVVIPVHDRLDALERCLASLGAAHPVVVVDDASCDELRVRAVAAKYGAAVVRHPENRGPAAARNTGLAHVHSELVAFVDSDVVPGAGWLDEIAAHFGDPLVAVVAPRVIALRADTAAGRYTRARGSLDLGPRPARVLPYTRVSYVPSAAFMARRSTLCAIAQSGDVFDERLRIGEDVDLVWRLIGAGHRVRFEPATMVAHDEPQAWKALLHRRFRYGTSAAALAQRHPGNIAPLILYLWPAATIAALLTRRPVLAAAAASAAVVRTRQTLRRAELPAERLGPMTAAALGFGHAFEPGVGHVFGSPVGGRSVGSAASQDWAQRDARPLPDAAGKNACPVSDVVGDRANGEADWVDLAAPAAPGDESGSEQQRSGGDSPLRRTRDEHGQEYRRTKLHRVPADAQQRLAQRRSGHRPEPLGR